MYYYLNDVGVKSPDPDACGALRGVIHINIHIECISANNIHTGEYLYKKEVKSEYFVKIYT